VLPESGASVGEVSVRGRVLGSPPPEYTKLAEQVIVGLLEEIQRQLNNLLERRKDPRILADLPIILYPLDQDCRVESPLSGRTRDISAGGLAFRTTTPPPTDYAYVVFENVRGTTGLALLCQIIWSTRINEWSVVSGGRY
jgi:hypothetical protein